MPSCSALPELTDEQIDSLPPEVRQTYRQPRAVDPAELVRFLGHTDLVNAAWAFLMPVYVDRDLLSVWPNVDPDFRAVLAQKWVRDNHYQMTVDGWNGEAVEAALAGPPDHPLWVHLERVHVRSFRAMLPDPATWGISSATRMVAPGSRRSTYSTPRRWRAVCGSRTIPGTCARSSCISSTGVGWCEIWGRNRTLR